MTSHPLFAVQTVVSALGLGVAGWGMAVVSRMMEIIEHPGRARGNAGYWLGLILGILGPPTVIIIAVVRWPA